MTDTNSKTYQPDNYVVLTGNTGAEAEERSSTETGETFVTLSLYTSNSYKDDNGERQEHPSTLHNIIAFNPVIMKQLQSFKAGSRLRIQGKLSYRTFEVIVDGQPVNKKEATIIAKKVELATLPSKKKAQPAETAKEVITA